MSNKSLFCYLIAQSSILFSVHARLLIWTKVNEALQNHICSFIY